MTRFPVFAAWFAAALWGFTALSWLYVPSSPFVDLGGDKVSPTEVAHGGAVKVTRNFRITREATMSVTRTMRRGDCKTFCEVIDMPSGKLTFPVGEHLGVEREHIISYLAQPGAWKLLFTLHWEDHFGRSHSQLLAPLAIEVLK